MQTDLEAKNGHSLLPPETVTDRVRMLQVFRHLPLGDLDRLLSRSEIRAYSSGAVLLEAGAPVSHVHVLLSGRASLRAPMPSGEELSVCMLGAGEWIGDGPALDRGPSLWCARAAEPLQSLQLSSASLREWLDQSPESAIGSARSLRARANAIPICSAFSMRSPSPRR